MPDERLLELRWELMLRFLTLEERVCPSRDQLLQGPFAPDGPVGARDRHQTAPAGRGRLPGGFPIPRLTPQRPQPFPPACQRAKPPLKDPAGPRASGPSQATAGAQSQAPQKCPGWSQPAPRHRCKPEGSGSSAKALSGVPAPGASPLPPGAAVPVRPASLPPRATLVAPFPIPPVAGVWPRPRCVYPPRSRTGVLRDDAVSHPTIACVNGGRVTIPSRGR